MKKVSWLGFLWCIALLIVPVIISWTNNFVLLHFHELKYYYTPSGMLLTIVVMTVEAPLIWVLEYRIAKAAIKWWEKMTEHEEGS